MKRCYGNMHDIFWSKHTITGSNKIHKEIAALIYHQEGRLPYVAILGTGTLHRDSERCAHEGSRGHECNHCTCDGHAESIVYEGAPKYFMNQMVHLVSEKKMSDSIFEIDPSSEDHLRFRLKSNIKFYLMVTDPPCGFIQNQEDPCMEWKVPFVGYPHVPTCSSRILIGATMGIQGYVSHLLVEPIFIDSVIILCTKDAEHQRIDFGGSFPLPKIKTRKYKPEDFASFKNQNLIKRKDPQHMPSTTDASNSTLSENIPAKTTTTASDGTKHGSLGIASAYKDGFSYLAINPRDGQEITGIPNFRIANKCINDCLSIAESVEGERKAAIFQKYDSLCDKLELRNALFRHQYKLKADVTTKKERVASLTNSVSTAMSDTCKYAEKISESKAVVDTEWPKRYKNNVESKTHNIKEEMKNLLEYAAMISSIENVLSNNEKLVMDCTWDCYFRMPNDTQTHPTDN